MKNLVFLAFVHSKSSKFSRPAAGKTRGDPYFDFDVDFVFCPPLVILDQITRGGAKDKGGGKRQKIRDLKNFSPAAGLKNLIFRRFRHAQKIVFRILRFFSAKRIDVDASVANKISFHGCRKRPLSLVK